MTEADVERRLSALEAKVAAMTAVREVVLRDIPYDQAKREILAFVQSNRDEPTYASDVELELCIPYEVARRALYELASEGRLRRGGG